MIELRFWAIYLTTFVAATGMALVFVPIARRAAFRLDILDHPGGYKKQDSPTPYLGGTAVAIAVFGSVALAAFVGLPLSRAQAVAILAMGLVLVVVGLVDDLRNLSLYVRLAAQAAAAVIVILAGWRVELFAADTVEILLTVAWVVGITNGMNLLDNMDGLAAGVAAIVAGWMFVIASLNGQYLVSALLVGLGGATLGFLRYNFHPASIYMGDAGSLFIGFLLAVCGMRLRFDAPIEYTWMIPVVVLGLPILDTSLVTVTRLRRRVSPFEGGRDHISHRLVQIGMSVRGAVLLLYSVTFMFGLLAFVVSRTTDWSAYLVAGVAFGMSVLGLIGLERLAQHRLVSGFEPQGETA